MYPRNAASPEPIAIGAVVQISDGAVQTSGCTVRIKPIGVAEADGAGTTAYSTDGIVLYTPTQAETNYTSFILIAKKTGCIPACVTVVTTASSVPGRTVPADGSITAAVIATDAIDADAIKADAVTEIQAGLATATNVSDAQTAIITQVDANETKIDAIQSDTNDIQTRLPAALESGRIAAALDSAATAALVDLIWDEPLTKATHNVATSSGKRLRQTNAFQQIDSTVIDASATTTTFTTDLDSAVDNFYNDSMLVFTDGALAGQVRSIVDYVGATKTIVVEEPLTSAPVNGVAFTIVSLHIHPVSQIQSGLATSAALAAAKTILDKIDSGMVLDGSVYQFTANMLELAPSSGGGSSDWTADERAAIRAILGIPASGTTPADPTTGILDSIRDLVVAYIAAALATVNGTSGTIVGFPATLNVGDSYTDEANASIHVFIRDASNDPITTVGDFEFTDPEFAPEVTITQSGSTGRVKAVVTYVDPGAPESYLKIEIPSSQSRRASPGTATIQCLLKWVDDEGKVLCQKTLSQQAITWNEMV